MDSTPRIRGFDDADVFLRRVGPFLLAREAEHSLLLGILTGLRAGIRYAGPPLLVALEDGDTVVAAALRTPPHNLVLSLAPDAAVDALAEGLADVGLPGVNGPRREAERFARRYGERRGLAAREATALALYRLTEVTAPAQPQGAYRTLAEVDRKLAERWVDAFQREAHAGAASDPAALIDAALRGRARGMAVWETDGAPVSLAGWSDASPRSVRIGPVYTPPELRGHGYASALVAELSQRRLDVGAHFCTLYTDLANPTSNGIYQRIGYRRLLDAVELVLTSSAWGEGVLAGSSTGPAPASGDST